MSTSFDASRSAATETVLDGDEAGPVLALSRGALIGRYSILDRLGEGGMGVVYSAFDPDLDRQIALKLLRAGSRSSEDRRVRLLREAQSLARLSHPNIIAVHDVGTWEDQVFVAMEFVQGDTLGDWLEDAKPDVEEVLRVFIGAGRGLCAVHRAGLVHRDFKPDNVMIGPGDRVRVMDFGLARGADDEPGTEQPSVPKSSLSNTSDAGSALDTPLTMTGAVMGTPAYMAPEQHMGEVADARSDQFSFCVALWQAVYGERPFEGRDRVSLAINVTQGNVRDAPREVKLPAGVHAALLRGLAVDPGRRHATLDALLAELDTDPARARTRRWAAAGFIGAVALGAAGASFVGGEPSAAAVDPCASAADDAGEVWGEARAASLRQSLGAIERAFATDTAGRVTRALDDWVGEWSAARVDACADTRVRAQQSTERLDRRMDCLGEALTEVDALVEVLSTADAGVLERAVTMTSDLPDFSHCSEPSWLDAPLPPPPAEHAAAIADARVELARSRARHAAGLYEESAASARGLWERVKPWEFAPLVAEVAKHRGDAEGSTADHEAALSAYEESFRAAWSVGMDSVATDALLAWVYTQGVRLEHADSVDDRLWLAQANVARLGSPPRLTARMHNVQGALANLHEDAESAVEHHERALELYVQLYGESSPALATAHINLGASRDSAGDLEGSLVEYAAAVDILVQVSGPDHPHVATVHHNIGSTLNQQRKFVEALEHFETAARIRERSLGADHPKLAMTHVGQANAFAELGRLREARESYDRTLEIFTERLGPEHGSVAAVLNNRANISHAMGAHEEALRDHRRSLEIRTATSGGRTLSAAGDHNNMAIVLRDSGRHAEALAEDRLALEIQDELGAPDGERVYSLSGMAQTLLEMGRFDEATELYERSRPMAEAAFGPKSDFVAYCLEGLGSLAERRGDFRTSRLHLERALEIRSREEGRADREARARSLLADALWGLGDYERARAEVERALQLVEDTQFDPARTDALRDWLREHPMPTPRGR